MSRRTTGSELPDFEGYLAAWSGLHGDYRPQGIARAWLRVVFVAARPLARIGAHPDLLTGWALLVAAAVLPTAVAGGRWALLGAAAVVASGLLDNVDGAVAAMTGRATRFGYLLDSLADRYADAAYLLALFLLGAPAGWCVGAGVALLTLEYARARAGNAGMRELGVVTVGERPTRVILAALAFAGTGAIPEYAATAATVGAIATLAVCAVGVVQLLVVARRLLR